MGYGKHTDEKWQKRWEQEHLYRFDPNKDNKLYCLEMFSYPSGAQLHVGHWYNYGLADIWARAKKMQGYNLFHPQGFDAFGLPAENYAIKTGIHPKDSTYRNIECMKEQLVKMGASYDFDYMVVTCDEEYYKWTQWLFLKLYERGLAYRAKAPVNWCPSCKTVLANEQVVEGCCERCHTEVKKEHRTQWFFKITDYAQRLLDGLEGLQWPEKTKKIQTNWIGKSTGAEVLFRVKGQDAVLPAFTTRVDTIYGVSFVVLAPEREGVMDLVTPEQQDEVARYIEQTKKISEIERLSTVRERTGVFTGSYAVNPVNGEEIPIYIADYVLDTYGTGCVMAVPAHDERDFDFATRYHLPIRQVIESPDGGQELPFCAYGRLINSGDYTGLSSEEARDKIATFLESKGMGEHKVCYRLRDWLVSRQRYWGAPIPIIYCDHCGEVPVPETDLPVKLPYDVEFRPDGDSPLAQCPSFMNTVCPKCGRPARRESDTLDTFVDSSWYFLRYPDNHNQEKPFDSTLINRLLPVDMYVGGAEHAAMHLLYARFITKVLHDMGLIDFDEPFLRLVHQGTILGPDGNKMSKSKGNTINPDDYIERYGSDVFRMYLAFGFSFVDGGPWNDDGIKAISKFVGRTETFVDAFVRDSGTVETYGDREKELDFVRHNTLKCVANDVEGFQFNTCIARLMELYNAMAAYKNGPVNQEFLQGVLDDFVRLLACFAPHFGEELWEKLGHTDSVFHERWTVYDPAKLVRDEIEMVIQLNGKVKLKMVLPRDLPREEVQDRVIRDPKVEALLEGRPIRKVIVVPNKLCNIVV